MVDTTYMEKNRKLTRDDMTTSALPFVGLRLLSCCLLVVFLGRAMAKDVQTTSSHKGHQLYQRRALVLGGQHFSNDEPSVRDAREILALRTT